MKSDPRNIAARRYYWRHRAKVLLKKRLAYKPPENPIRWDNNPAFKEQRRQFKRLQTEVSRAKAATAIRKRAPELREKWLKNLKRARSHPNFKDSPKALAARRRCIAIAKEAAMRSPKLGWRLKIRGPMAVSAKVWRLRSPNNKTFEFSNLNHFIRAHPEFFKTEDVVWKRAEDSRFAYCNASHGISSLSPARKRPNLSWKGWTWASTNSVSPASAHDLLDRVAV